MPLHEALLHLDQAILKLRHYLRTKPSLSPTDQLFIENRLRALQIEYATWLVDHKVEKTSSQENRS